MLDADILGAGLAEIIREEVGLATSALTDEVADLRRQLAERPTVLSAETVQRMITEAVGSIPAPEVALSDAQMAGVSLIAEETAREVAEAVTVEKIAALPVPQDGKDGKDGENGWPQTYEQIIEAVRTFVAENPPADGKDGADGRDGKDGADGKDAEPVTAEQLNEAVHRHLQSHPIHDGKDGIGLAGALIDKDGQLVVTLTDGTMRELGTVVGRDGIDAKGEPGRDALTLEAFDTELSEDGRFLTLSLDDGLTRVSHKLQLATMIYRGVFKEGETYLQGDTVTWAGSVWHCNAETTAKPDDGRDWTLAVKRGSPGKDAVTK